MEVRLYFNNVNKAQTRIDGFNVDGTLETDNFCISSWCFKQLIVLAGTDGELLILVVLRLIILESHQIEFKQEKSWCW